MPQAAHLVHTLHGGHSYIPNLVKFSNQQHLRAASHKSPIVGGHLHFTPTRVHRLTFALSSKRLHSPSTQVHQTTGKRLRVALHLCTQPTDGQTPSCNPLPTLLTNGHVPFCTLHPYYQPTSGRAFVRPSTHVTTDGQARLHVALHPCHNRRAGMSSSGPPPVLSIEPFNLV